MIILKDLGRYLARGTREIKRVFRNIGEEGSCGAHVRSRLLKVGFLWEWHRIGSVSSKQSVELVIEPYSQTPRCLKWGRFPKLGVVSMIKHAPL